MPRNTIQIQQPLAGLDRNYAYQSQPPFSLADANNVRGRSTFDQRSILGSRPGLVKAFPQCVCTASAVESVTQTFEVSNDAYLFGGDPNGVQGGNHNTGRANAGVTSGLYRSLYYFNLTSLLGSTVTHCNMKLGSLVGVQFSQQIFSANRITQPGWVDTQVTWNRYTTSLTWAAGGDFTTTGAAPYLPATSGAQHNTIIDITALALDAVVSRSGHLHVLLKKLDESVAAGNSMATNFNIEDPTDLAAVVDVSYEVAV
jgi:hypothetical protein